MNGKMINSDFLDGMEFKEAMQKTMDYFERKGWGERVTTYKLRDWLISRQRYWGAPIPIVYDPDGKPHPVKEKHLPWLLPTDVDFKPKGESPLKSSKEFIARTEKLYGKGWRPEFDTMDTFVDSSWYFLRYTDARNTAGFADPKQLKTWLPVDLYLIGPEHIVLHLLYSRFFTRFLRDEGYLTISEPFTKMRHQGMILGPDGKKMSKSKGNVINPDEIVNKFGADTLRVYEMFMGPLETDKPWDDRAVAGVNRFLKRVYRLAQEKISAKTDPSLEQKLHQTLRKVTEDLPVLKFNTAIAAMMELLNLWEKVAQKLNETALSKSDLLLVIKMLAPFAPFMAEELYAQLAGVRSASKYQGVHTQSWPEFDSKLAEENQVTIAVQVDGKLRSQLVVDRDQLTDKELILTSVKNDPAVKKWLEGRKITKEIYIPGRIVSLVTG
jgi:leucyl-tRNA synthetase